MLSPELEEYKQFRIVGYLCEGTRFPDIYRSFSTRPSGQYYSDTKYSRALCRIDARLFGSQGRDAAMHAGAMTMQTWTSD